MIWFVVSIVFSVLATIVIMPIFLFFATPCVLLAPIVRGCPERRYWRAVGRSYWKIIRELMEWGPFFFDF